MSTETNVAEREERFSSLDQFAREGETRRGGEVMNISPFNAPTERVFGAQQLAVMRDESKVLAKLRALAAAAGTDWYYRYPVKNRKENRTDWIEGPSIKLANDLSRLYGNCDIDVRVQDLGTSWLIYARFIDLETGYSLVRPFQQQKGAGKIGGDDNARRLDIAFQIGASKAIRNVVVNALQTFADFAFEEAKNALVDKIGKDIENWRSRTATRLAEHVDVARVEAVIGRKVAEWLAPDVARVIAMMKAVSDGMAMLDETFPPMAADKSGDGDKKDAKADLDQFADGDKTPGDAGAQQQKPADKPNGEAAKKSEPSTPAHTEGSEGGEGTSNSAATEPSAGEPRAQNQPADGDLIAQARRDGAEAKAKGMTRKALPAKYRKNDDQMEAWLAGFDSGSAEREPGEEG